MNNKLITQLMILVVGVLLASSLLVPIISEARTTAGDPIMFTSGGAGTGYNNGYREITENVNIVYDVSSDGLSINGVPVDYVSSATWGSIIIGEYGAVALRVSTYGVQLQKYTDSELEVISNVVPPMTITLNGSVVTFGDYTLDIGSGFYLDQTGDYFLAVDMTNRFGDWYVNDIGDVTAYGVYTTGEHDTSYSVVNGVVSTSMDYDSDLHYTLTKVDGTTDVFKLSNLKVEIGGEEFTPYNSLIIKNCYGHKDGGSAYSLYGVIPLLFLVALVVFSVRLVKRDE